MNDLIDDKYYKNYKRGMLAEIQGNVVVLTGKYKATWENHVTFTTIRPYIQDCKTKTICDHINLSRIDVEKVINIADLEKNRKYYIFGYCKTYSQGERMGVKLALGEGFCPIIKAADFNGIPAEIARKCYQFESVRFAKC